MKPGGEGGYERRQEERGLGRVEGNRKVGREKVEKDGTGVEEGEQVRKSGKNVLAERRERKGTRRGAVR